jgi:magnesium chelatase family protein
MPISLDGLRKFFASHPPEEPLPPAYQPDFSEVRGQRAAKRALEVAVAGGHNLIMIGPPGSGKSMLSKRVPSILPPLDQRDLTELHAIYQLAGQRFKGTYPPFQAPHSTASPESLIGGGRSVPKPGMITLAHHGVLFLDELPEFKRNALEPLRQPLEDGQVTISRTNGTRTYPASFMLIAAMNPCPCGFAGTPQCRCKPEAVAKYRKRISGPLMDRIDIQVQVPAVSFDTLQGAPGEASTEVRQRVIGARSRQYKRAEKLNAELEMGDFDTADIDQLADTLLSIEGNLYNMLKYSARSYVRILRVARTIADLSRAERITTNHILEALSYRIIDK